ncbi:MAG: LCP family protein [Rhodococcus sp. (in: high G+C Gram-positive bacteria)]
MTGLRILSAVVSVVVLAVTGFGWHLYHGVAAGLTQSGVLVGEPTSSGSDQNILVMGLDSRLDEKGQPLPADIYDALHAGDDSVGGYNANVLILLHIPSDGSKATAISIPRDDYVDLAGCTANDCKGKIKQAYGEAADTARKAMSARGVTDTAQLEQQSRDAGRRAEIATVRKFLGGVPIDHFVEVTLVAFFQIAQVVQPIEVCLNEDTSDSYSGAKFRQGVQEVDAAQAVAFVRQRRDPNTDLNFTDLDRNRRQQAFIISLSRKLQQNGTLTSISKLQGILDVAKQNIAVDSDPDVASFAKTATKLTGGNIAFYTLPVDHFGQNDNGEDVNIVDLSAIHTTVAQLLGHGSSTSGSASIESTPSPTTSGTVGDAEGTVLDVVNSSGRTGLAAQLETELSARGFTQGSATTGAVHATSTLEYGSGAAKPAQQLGEITGLPAVARADLPAHAVRLTVGTGFTVPAALSAVTPKSSPSIGTSTPPAPMTAVPATGTGENAPAPTDLTKLTGADIPCVK